MHKVDQDVVVMYTLVNFILNFNRFKIKTKLQNPPQNPHSFHNC